MAEYIERMTEYIERETLIALVESIDWYSVQRGKLTTGAKSSENALYKANDIYAAIDNAPSADVAPVRHGRWLNFYGDFSTAECDICAEIYEVSPDEPCRKEFFDAFKEFYKFCPNCGAKMNEEVTDNG